MPINYDEIIERAHQRKNALQRVAKAMERHNEMVDHLEKAALIAAEIRDALKGLDDEAVGMLGRPEVATNITWCDVAMYGWARRLDKPAGAHGKSYVTAAWELAAKVS